MHAMAKLTTIDLFAGAGGMSEGFKQAGFNTLFANDHEKPAVATFRRNHAAETSSDDIETLDAEAIRQRLGLNSGELDVLIGGPPCQGFSTYGKRDEEDTRNQLYMHFIRFLGEFQPKAFVIENVTGILSMSEGRVVQDICQRVRDLGYGCTVWTLDAREYGVPQRRRRVFITGMADGGELALPTPTHSLKAANTAGADLFGDTLPAPLTIHDAISDLPADTLKPRETHQTLEYGSLPQSDYQRQMRGTSETLTHHSSKQMLGIRRLRLALMHPGDYGTRIDERLAETGIPEEVINRMLGGEGLRDINECRKQDREREIALREMLSSGNTSLEDIKSFMDSQGFANKYRRLQWDEPSHTLVAHMARDCSDFVHPLIDRFISVREAARLQSFPDTYYFDDSQFCQLRQIGNAVPPLLAKAVAGAVKVGIMQRLNREVANFRENPEAISA